MDKLRKLELLQRSLGLRHKIKVHESMKAPESHEDLAIMTLAKWELEDEVRAIEDLLAEGRSKNVALKRKVIGSEDDSLPLEERGAAAAARIKAKRNPRKGT
ncbi:hypothetical protein WDW37_07865 [Bdellovibrionota bacterium FG-1]